MKCGHDAHMSTTSEALEPEPGLMVIRNIPCWKCGEYGEVLYTVDVVRKIGEITERTKRLPQKSPSSITTELTLFFSVGQNVLCSRLPSGKAEMRISYYCPHDGR